MVKPSSLSVRWRVVLVLVMTFSALALVAKAASSEGAPAASVSGDHPKNSASSSSADEASAKAAIRIALYRGPGTGGKGPPNLKQRLNAAPKTSITELSPEAFADGSLTNYDVIIFAGGSGSKQAESIGKAGREAVRQFVAGGGGYIGICAGAYLATSGFSWSLHIINAKTISSKWKRGRGDVKVELTERGRSILGERTDLFDVHYANGPVVEPGKDKTLPPYLPLAYFRTELSENDSPPGVMVNAPAVFAGEYKAGRVVCISPHPEQTPGLEAFVPRAVEWVAAARLGAGAK